LQVDDIESAVQQNLGAIDDFFVQAVTEALNAAREAGDFDRSAKVQRVLTVLEAASAPPPGADLIDDLLAVADDEAALQKIMEARGDEITSDLLQTLAGVVTQIQASLEQLEGQEKSKQQEILDRLQAVYNAALLVSMKRNFKAG